MRCPPSVPSSVVEPAFLLTDSAIVGALGTGPLAGLGLASAVLSSIVGLFVVLAYGTTASVARRLGAGDERGALAVGIDGTWLAVGVGAVVTVLGVLGADRVVAAFGAPPAVASQAQAYLTVSLLGIPAMLVVLAATGALRGLQDTRTPLLVAVVGFTWNAVLSLLLVHGLGPLPSLGIAGSAWGTVAAQLGMAGWLLAVVVRGARRRGARLSPHLGGIRTAARAGVPLLLRTVTLRTALLVTTWVATGTGVEQLAAHQVAFVIWTLGSLALDAVAIAAQALTGRYLGASDAAGASAVTRTMVRWGVGGGVVFGVLLAALSPLVPYAFTDDPDVRRALVAVLLVVALTSPLAGYVFVLDGVLIGAGDGPYLARAGLVALVVYLPAAGAVRWLGLEGTPALVWLWVAFAGLFMGARGLTLGLRERSGHWLVLGVPR